jgi:sulfatase modifying factor 1
VLLVSVVTGCRDGESHTTSRDAGIAPVGSLLIGPPTPEPTPRRGMVWIPSGALVAGTPPDRLPRIADEEIPGEQLILKGFYIDTFPFPNEEGAIPLTNVTQAEALGLCAEQGKRLCSELEWERGCKGPNNYTFEYGDTYRPDRCNTGKAPKLRPNGLSVGCVSEFGVRDMHGGAWEWTFSPWGRGGSEPLVTTRGGNSSSGELVARCANGVGRPADSRSGVIGFRCCAGAKNDTEVTLQIDDGKKLEPMRKVDRELAARIVRDLDEETRRHLRDVGDFTADRMWFWRPLGNEELVAVSGCTALAVDPRCGVAVARLALGEPKSLIWADSGMRVPSLQVGNDAGDLLLTGGDRLGTFQRRIHYAWGRLSPGDKQYRPPASRPRSKSKSKR